MTQPAPPRAASLLASPEDLTRIWVTERARRLRQQLGDEQPAQVPLYGDRDWHRLPPNDPRRWLALIAAAEAWRHDGDPHVIAARLDLELDAHWRASEDDYAGWRDVAARVRADGRPGAVSHDELQRRRTALPAGYLERTS